MTSDGLLIPDNLAHLGSTEDGKMWLAALPEIYRSAIDRFGLQNVGTPFSGGSVSLVVPAKQRSAEVVLKIQFPHPECRHEAKALETWNGNGAIRLIGREDTLHALLLERCRPGHPISSDQNCDRIGEIAKLIRLLSVAATEPFTDLRQEAGDWMVKLTQAPKTDSFSGNHRLVDAAVSILRDLLKESWDPVLLHQDLHGDNILASDRAGYLAIDPKPIVGDPAFSIGPTVRSFELGHSRKEVFYRLDRLTEELALDRERARLWTIGQTAAWNFGSSVLNKHLETAFWLLDR